MSLPDPITVALDGNPSFAKVYSPNQNQAVYRKEIGNHVYTLTATQAVTKTRSRHLIRLDSAFPDPVSGIQQSLSISMTIDEPIVNPTTDADMTYLVDAFKATVSDAIIGKLLNGEL